MMKTKTLNLTLIRYLNLFEKITKVRTDSCFIYNNTLFFAVPKGFVYRAVGGHGKNIKDLSQITGKKIKVIEKPESDSDFEKFVIDIISPVQSKGIEINAREVIIKAGKLNYNALIGRDKQKFKELQKIIEEYLGKELKIV